MRAAILPIVVVCLLIGAGSQIALAAEPQLSDLDVRTSGSNSAVLVWTTDVLSDSNVTYWDKAYDQQAPGNSKVVSNATLTLAHFVSLTGLINGHEYGTVISSTASGAQGLAFVSFTFRAPYPYPQWSEITQYPADVQAGQQFTVSVRWHDGNTLKYVELYTNITEGGFGNQDTNITAVPAGTTDYVSTYQLTAPSSVGSTLKWFMKAVNNLGAGGNSNVTPTRTITITDRNAPAVTANANTTSVPAGGSFRITADLSDDTGLSAAWFETNESGSWKKGTDVRTFSNVAGSATVTAKDRECWVTQTTTYGNEITASYFESQSFTVTRHVLSFFVVRMKPASLQPPLAPISVLMEIRPDKGGYPDMSGVPLARAFSTNSHPSGEYDAKFNLDAGLTPGTTYHAVLRGSSPMKTGTVSYVNDYCGGVRDTSADGGTTWQSTTGDWNFWTYTHEQSGPTSANAQFTATTAGAQAGTTVGWRVLANDSWGNTGTSGTGGVSVGGCPAECVPGIAPGGCGEWSECTVRAGQAAGIRTKICFSCGIDTGYACNTSTVSEPCQAGMDASTARDAIDSADDAITSAKAANKNTTLAESLLARARDLYANGEWEAARDAADSARAAALNAVTIIAPGEDVGWAIPVLIAACLIAVALAFAWTFKLLKIPKFFSHVKEMPAQTAPAAQQSAKSARQPAKEAELVCSICGRTFPRLYTCAQCGGQMCFEDARTYKGKPYCVSCLHKKGLL